MGGIKPTGCKLRTRSPSLVSGIGVSASAVFGPGGVSVSAPPLDLVSCGGLTVCSYSEDSGCNFGTLCVPAIAV